LEGDRIPLNVWVGTSVEDQTRADERIPALLKIPAVGRFLSVEPLLGQVDLSPIIVRDGSILHLAMDLRMCGVHWVIIGGESGPGARPCNVDWIRSLIYQCGAAGVPVFVKQLGARARDLVHDEDGNPLGTQNLLLTHPKGGDPADWPEDLRVREFPEGLR
jgi:protein gp37